MRHLFVSAHLFEFHSQEKAVEVKPKADFINAVSVITVSFFQVLNSVYMVLFYC